MSLFQFEIRHIQSLVAVVDEGNFSAAAVALGVSQPAISQNITRLEQFVGMPLLERKTRPAKLTNGGQDVYRLSKKLLYHASELNQLAQLTASDSFDLSKVSIGVIDSLMPAFAPFIVEHLGGQVGELSIVSDSVDNLLKRAESQELDLVIVAYSGELSTELRSFTVLDDPYYIVSSAWCDRSRLITYNATSQLGEAIEHICFEQGLLKDSEIKVSSLDVALKLVNSGVGWTITNRLGLYQLASSDDLKLEPIDDTSLFRRVSVVCGKSFLIENAQLLKSKLEILICKKIIPEIDSKFTNVGRRNR